MMIQFDINDLLNACAFFGIQDNRSRLFALRCLNLADRPGDLVGIVPRDANGVPAERLEFFGRVFEVSNGSQIGRAHV